MARDIFRCDLEEIYQRQTLHRNEPVSASRDALREIIESMASGVLDSDAITKKMTELADRLRFHSGKMVYGYLRPPLKAMVDDIVDELAKDSRVAAAYAMWCEERQEVIRSYKDTPEPIVPFFQNKEFKQVRNLVVKEAALLMQGGFSIEALDEVAEAVLDESFASDTATQNDGVPDLPIADDQGDPDGNPYAKWTDRYKWALTFLYGIKTDTPSFDDAWELLHQEAEAGNALAMHDLGRMLEKGLGREIDLDGAHIWYAKALSTFHAVEAAEPGRYVEYRIGKMYNAGLGTDQDHEKAALWFGRSVSQQYKYAQYSLGCLYRDGKGVEKDTSRAFDLFSYSAEQDFPYAAFECGKMLRDGIGTEKNPAEADRSFREAFLGFRQLEAERPDDMLQYRLGWMLLTETGTEMDVAEAERYFTLAARQNNVHAQYQLAKLIFSEPDPSTERMAKALEWMHKAAEAGLDSAQYALGKLYQENERLLDINAALHWLTRAATPCEKNPLGNPYAQYRLSKLMLAGNEAPQDIPAALYWLQLSANQDISFSQYALGMAWLREEQAGVDAAKAVPWLERAATQGHEVAAYQLGKLYLTGELVEKNTDAGLRWMTLSAEAGNQYAQYALGKFYLFGDSTLRDEQAAVHWLALSAAQGNVYAAFLLERREQWQRGAVLLSGSRLLSGIGRIFSSLPPPDSRTPHFAMDRKRRRELWQKKGGKGIDQGEMEMSSL